MATIGDVLRKSAERLREAGTSTPALDARLLLMAASGLSYASLLGRSEEPLPSEATEKLDGFIQRRLNHEPVHRILGKREFYGRDFVLSDDTLVPRPDTEILIDCVCRIAETLGRPLSILDLGTGTGVIAITIAAELEHVQVVGVDISAAALLVAEKNAVNLGVEDRVRFVESNLFEVIDGRFDVIVSNPPYIRSEELGSLDDDVRLFDPTLALDGGPDGLNFYRKIFGDVSAYLEEGGWICLEIGHDQGQDVSAIAHNQGFVTKEIQQDLAGHDRVVIATRQD